MFPNDLFIKHEPIQIKIQSKQQFFTIKKNQKRLKTSQCFSQPIQKENPQKAKQDINTLLINNTKGQLQSTFGSQTYLAFKGKQFKLKKYLKIQSIKSLRDVYQSESDNDSLKNTVKFNRSKIKSSLYPSKRQDRVHQIHTNTMNINNFHIFEKIGQGTYSEVYKALHKNTGFLCAIKILQKWKMISLNVVENVLRQIKINYFLNHGHICKIYSFFDDRNYVYLICQYATDKNIFTLLKQPKMKLTKGLFSDTISKILYQVCQAIEFIHKHSIIHRDIKPQNILITMHQTVKICDFGWAIYNPTNTMRKTLCGTPLYLAPQLIKQVQYDESIDIWAIGIITYEMFTNQNPFKINNFQDLQRVVYDEVKFEGFRNKKAVDFIKKALEKDISKRSSISELINHPFLASVNENQIMIN